MWNIGHGEMQESLRYSFKNNNSNMYIRIFRYMCLYICFMFLIYNAVDVST